MRKKRPKSYIRKIPNLQQKIRQQKKNIILRDVYNITIYVSQKITKCSTLKFTWKTRTRNSQHQLQHRERHWTCAKTLIEARG